MLIQHSGSQAGGHREGIDSQHQERKKNKKNTPSLALKKQDQALSREDKVRTHRDKNFYDFFKIVYHID